MRNETWENFYIVNKLGGHDFKKAPFFFTASQLKEAASGEGNRAKNNEPRILCKQDRREDRPDVFIENDLFILPVKNGQYCLLKGDGYLDLYPIDKPAIHYTPKLDFELKSLAVGDSEMQHLDYAFIVSMIRTISHDSKLQPTIRGRKYTPELIFFAGRYKHKIRSHSVQTEVDAGYEGPDQIVLVEAKSKRSGNIINRQIFYPACQWFNACKKPIKSLFFQKNGKFYDFWEIAIQDPSDYHSLKVVDTTRFIIQK